MLSTMHVSFDTKKLVSFALVAFMFGGLLGTALWNYGGVYVPTLSQGLGFGNMRQFASVDELKEFLEENSLSNGYGLFMGDVVRLSPSVGKSSSVVTITGHGFAIQSSDAAQVDYSSTNVQVEGVDEADMVKTDGSYIYVVRDRTVIIIEAYPAEDARVVYRLNVSQPVQDIYVSGDKLVVFSYMPRFWHYDEASRESFQDKESARVTVYDISDRASPTEERDLSVDGYYYDSRLIGEYLYFIITSGAYLNDDQVVLPVIRDGKTWCAVQAEDIWYPNATRGWADYYTITSVNIQDPESQMSSETFLLDGGTTLYVSLDNMYIVGQRWWSKDSEITKIGISGGSIVGRGNATVPGYVLNQFSMDEHNGYFRVATTSHNWRTGTEGNNVYVLDENMKTVGRLENLAPGEEIYSARFMGDRCYLVTFKKVDPLFTIDLSDPENPRVLGKLKIPGYSDYLHPYDENTLIGIGKETEEAKEGDFAWYQGVKISLFDVSDVENPRELAKIEIGDRGTDSPALYDHHAFLFSRERNLLVIPVLEAGIDEGDFSGTVPANFHGEYVYQGAYVFHISRDGIELRGTITHIDDDSLLKSGFYFDSEYSVERSLYIEDNLYTISRGMLKVNDLGTLEEIVSVELGEG
jgi:inhibitor of cysteine peptidase